MTSETYTPLSSRALFARAVNVAWPAVLESFFITLAGMIDTMMVATLGSSAVAAVALTQQPKFVGMSPFIAMNVAISAIVARRKGEKRRESANETLLTALCLAWGLLLLVSTLCVAFAPQMMRFAGSNADTHDDAVIYFRIIMGGLFFAMTSFIINAAQRGSGNTRIAMVTNLTSSVVNICFNYLLIGGKFGFPRLGIVGAALATVLGTVVACLMSIRSLLRNDSYVQIRFLVQEKLRPSKKAFLSIKEIAVNIFAENILMRIGFVATAMVAARLGTEIFAVHNVSMSLLVLSFSFADGMQVAAVALSGEALGAEHKEEAKRYGSTCQKIGLCISLSLSLLLFFGARTFYRFYFQDEHLIELGLYLDRYIMFIMQLQISQVIFGACLRAAGDVKYCMRVSFLSVTVIRTVTTLLLTQVIPLGLTGVWLGITCDQLGRLCGMAWRFRQGKWVDLKV